MSAILKDEPQPILQVQPLAPPALDRVVKTCLAKDPDERWQSMHDIATELEWIADQSQSKATVPKGFASHTFESCALVDYGRSFRDFNAHNPLCFSLPK